MDLPPTPRRRAGRDLVTATARAPKPPTELEQVIDRLRRAASDLEGAAYEAGDAINEIQSALGPDEVQSALRSFSNPGATSLVTLAEMVVRLHDEEHEGPRMWCSRDVCRKADEALS